MRRRESMSALDDLSSLLQTTEPTLFELPGNFPMPPDPVAWAHRVCAAHLGDLRVQAMPRAVGVNVEAQDRALNLVRDAAPDIVGNVITGISNGAAAHAAMDLWQAHSFGERVADPAVEPFKNFVTDTFGARLRQLHPVGYHTQLTLWFSADEHVYDAHCDVSDGVLCQLTGEKVVEVWPVPDERKAPLLFDHSYRHRPMTTRGQRFTVSAGQALFIPEGAMHEVVVAADQISVSLSLHTGSPFPLLELCRDLDHMVGRDGAFGLPKEMMQRDKFYVVYFEPARFRGDGARDHMPESLREALCAALIRPAGYSRQDLNGLLDGWWRAALSAPSYPGPDLPPESVPWPERPRP